MKSCIITLDVGGTTITVGAVDLDNQLIGKPSTYESKSNYKKDEILEHFITIIQAMNQSMTSLEYNCKGISIGMPGPFDYELGISYMKDLDKYDALYKYPLKEMLFNYFKSNPLNTQYKEYPIVFENDATLFAFGNCIKLNLGKHHRLMSITIGTGCGSSFIVDNQIIKSNDGIPEDGAIFHLPFTASNDTGDTIDDVISKRGILKLAKNCGYSVENLDIIDLYKDANAGNTVAKNIFSIFGNNLLSALKPTIDTFKPETLVIGGQIAKSFDLFKKQIESYCLSNAINIYIIPNTSDITLIGAGYYFLNQSIPLN